VTFCLGIALFLLLSEVVTTLYHPAEHALGLEYLMFGVQGLSPLVAWFWAALAANIVAFVMLLIPRVRKDYRLLPVACVLIFAGIWVQKGSGLLVPGYIPSPIGEFSNYLPTTLEVLVGLGNWAIGFFILTILAKGAIGILLGEVKYASEPLGVRSGVVAPFRTSFEPTRMQPWAPSSDPNARVEVGGGAGRGSRARRQGRVAVG